MMSKKNKVIQTKVHKTNSEIDTAYLLKLVLYLVIGAQWVHIENSGGTTHIPIPIGLLIGMMFATHDHFNIDRKIEYAVLLVATFVGFWAQVGIYITY